MTALKFQLPFYKKEKLNDETFTFYFDRSLCEFDFFAGQYFRVTLSIDNPDERGSSRYFTISSSPNDKFLTITTKIIKSSFKLKLNNLKKGELVTFFGPFGEMVQKKIDKAEKVMIAGGMGITPAHSIIKFIDQEKLDVSFTLLTSFSTREQAIFFDELKTISKNNPNIKVFYFLTKDKEEDFEFGRIDMDAIKKIAPQITDSKVFIAGPPAMVGQFQDVLVNMGVNEDTIVVEDFSGY